jgi:hypothetical protein
MLMTIDHFNALALVLLGIAIAPLIGSILWTRLHAEKYLGFSGSRQLLYIFAPIGWMMLVGIPSLNFRLNHRTWCHNADVRVFLNDNYEGVRQEEMILISSANYRFADGRNVSLRADKAHYSLIINDSGRTIGRRSVLYGRCPPDSPYTRTAFLSRDPDLDIPPGAVIYNTAFGYFGNDPDKPPREITIALPRPEMFDRCEYHNYFAPLAADKPTPRQK